MTEDQKQMIRIFRFKGYGYKRIAQSLGLSRDAVRSYCIRNNINGYGTELVNQREPTSINRSTFKFCLQCGKKLEQEGRGRKRKYCSKECKNEWEKEHPILYKNQCDYCGTEFTAARVKDQKFCSRDCYIRDRFNREEDAEEIVSKILKRETVTHIPKWFKELFLSYIKD